MNQKVSSEKMTHLAAEILRDPNATHVEKSLAGSVLSQADPEKQTGDHLETVAAEVLRHSDQFSSSAVSLAGSVLAQGKKHQA